MNSNPVVLGYLDADANVFISGKQYGICDRLEAGEFNQVGNDERIDALLLSMTVYETKPQFHIVQIRNEGLVRSGSYPTYCAIIPIDAEFGSPPLSCRRTLSTH